MLAGEYDGKVHLLVTVSKDLTSRQGRPAGQGDSRRSSGAGAAAVRISPKPGGKDPSKINALLAKARELVQSALAS